MKAGADFEQAGDAAAQVRSDPSVGSVMRERNFSSVDLPAPLRPMMPDDFALGNIEADVAQRPEMFFFEVSEALEAAPNARAGDGDLACQELAEIFGALEFFPQPVFLRHIAGFRRIGGMSDDVGEEPLHSAEIPAIPTRRTAHSRPEKLP